ncbi:MAG: hypothetical protein WC943_07035 [Elusimicrobiota bacterium]|jgi:cytoskeletal protein RodZ
MSDLIGLKKYSKPSAGEDDPAGEAPAVPAPGAKPFGSQGLWMGLLVVDSLLIAVFGSYLGVVGMKAYHQWKGKPGASVAVQSKAQPKPEPAKTETAKPETAKPEPAKPEPSKPETAKPEPAKPEPAKPETAKTAAKPAKEPPPPSLSASNDTLEKAVSVEFSHHAPNAKSVKLAGAFLVRSGGRKDMVRGSGGDWDLTLFLKPGTYRYWFLEDGKKKVDPRNSKVERGASVVVVYPK